MQDQTVARLATLVATCLTAALAPAQARGGFPRNGHSDLTDPASGEFVIRYAVRAPSGLSRKKPVGLIVCMHGEQGSEAGMFRIAAPLLTMLKLSDDYVLVGFKSRGETWEDVDYEPLRKGVAWALDSFPIDRRRVYGWGYSTGGFALTRFASRFPGILAGVVLFGGGAERGGEQAPAERGTQFYHLHGDADPKVDLAVARAAHQSMVDDKYRHVYREMIGEGHNVTKCTEVALDAMAWCHALRQRSIAPTADDAKLIEEVAGRLEQSATVTARLIEQLGRIGGPEAGGTLAKALRSPHAAVRAAAAQACQTTLFGAPTTEALAETLGDTKSKKARNAAFDALGRAANWQYAEAQQALCEHAADAALPAATRIDAIEQLARLIPMEQVSNFKSWDVWESLIDLLMDPSGKVRRAALDALMGNGAPPVARSVPTAQPPSKNGFGYSPKGRSSSREAAAKKWREWLQKQRTAAEATSEPRRG